MFLPLPNGSGCLIFLYFFPSLSSCSLLAYSAEDEHSAASYPFWATDFTYASLPLAYEAGGGSVLPRSRLAYKAAESSKSTWWGTSPPDGVYN